MQKIILLCLFINLAAAASIKSFLNQDPFCKKPPPLPLSKVRPSFLVYTRSNSTTYMLYDKGDSESFVQRLDHGGFFALNRQVIFIVHGYLNNNNTHWLSPMKDAILREDDSTVIIVDWRYGADFQDYAQAASNTQITAAAVASIAQAVANLERFSGDLNQLYLYCIGHSLGAQVCGQAGRSAKTSTGQSLFDRVTGLDPAGPGFAKCSDNLHIDKDSADCVDIIHTDGTFKGHLLPVINFGTLSQWGHMDFYPNSGQKQPGCLDIKNDIGFCSHEKAHDFFMTTINRPNACSATGKCTNVELIPESCANNVTQNMGYYSSCHAKSQSKIEGVFYVTTTKSDLFC